MATNSKPLRWPFLPGIKRDGTIVEGDYCTDGQWCRFNDLGMPKKMGGYRMIRNPQQSAGPVYGMWVYVTGSVAYIYTVSANGIEVQPVDTNLGNVAGALVQLTPSGFGQSSSNIGQFDAIYDSTGADGVLLAHVAPNLLDIASRATAPLYYGSLVPAASGSNILTATTAPNLSGGVCVLHPYAFVYGDDGRVAWCGAGTPNTWVGGDSGSARISESKIIRGMSTRGADGSSPAGLFFSLNSLVRASYIGGTAIFQFNTVAEDITPISSRGFVNYDGVTYWADSGRFLMYDGSVREVPNQLNVNYFFDAIRSSNRQLVWATKMPRHGEIWFMYPRQGATQATHAVIYKPKLQTWYDTVLPDNGRSDGFFPTAFRYPVWAGVDVVNSKYALWQHEYQASDANSYDRIAGSDVAAVDSYITTGDISLTSMGKNANLRTTRVELDLNQTGPMELTLLSRPYPRSADTLQGPATFDAAAAVSDGIRSEGRYVRAKFRSNVAGGFYELGRAMTFQTGEGVDRPAGA